MVAVAKGVNEMRDRIPVLTRIEVAYTIDVGDADRAVVDRALSRHVDKCPTAQSLKGAVEVSWTAEIRTEGKPVEG